MDSEENSFGEIFRSKRKERNISLREVENATSIRISYLQAIENAAIDQLISPVYAQGFVRQYATFLGLDGESILKDYHHLFRKPEEQEFAYGIGTLEKRHNSSSSAKSFTHILWALAFIVGFAAAYYFAHALELI